jgi:transposase-like protein
MATVDVWCMHCGGKKVYKHGLVNEKQRYRCLEKGCGRTFLLDYTKKGFLKAVKDQILEMAMNGRGIRDTARVLKISTTTVIQTLKKKAIR